MAFQFKKAEAPEAGWRRVCRERIGVAQARLREGGRPAAVHCVRKEIKKLRALFRLMRGEIGRGAYRKGTKALREAAGCLAASRDSRVILRAFEKLAGRSALQNFPEIQKALEKNCRNETRRFRSEHSVRLANQILKKTGRRVRKLKIKADGWAAIAPGLKRSYRDGRGACRLVHLKPKPEQFHEWRKHVKDLWYYFCLLSPALPAAMRIRTVELERLGELLGDDHDLFLLQQFLVETGTGSYGEAEALKELIEDRQRKLRDVALKLGYRLYAATPAVICRRLGDDWNIWRGETRRKYERRFLATRAATIKTRGKN